MKVACFGEILFDVFEGNAVIGGAPFNLCAHMAKLGDEAYMISALGDDDNGKKAMSISSSLGVKTDCISLNSFPTGYCNVTLEGRHPRYELCRDAAFDHISYSLNNDISFDAFCFGTLAQRNDDSARALYSILDTIKAKEIFCDINIRSNFHSKEIIEKSLNCTTVLKFSREEFSVFKRYDICNGNDIEKAAHELSDKFDIPCVVVTLDKDGAFAYENGITVYSQKPLSAPVSTVGAGDSFSACFLHNRISGKPLAECLRRGVILSDYIVTQLGAVPDIPEALINEIC